VGGGVILYLSDFSTAAVKVKEEEEVKE